MPYLICDKCEIYYEIDPNFDLNTLQTCEKCSEDLKYYENFDEYYKEKDPNPVYEEADSYNDYIENKNLDYHTISTIGFILAVIGLLVFVLAYVSPFFLIPQNLDNFQNSSNISNFFIQIILIYAISIILMVAGVLIYLYSKRKGKIGKNIKKEGQKNSIYKRNTYKSAEKEKLASDYLKKLPEGYFILNNLRIPGRKIKIDRVVIGPTGIFLTMTQNLRGHYIINDNEWLNDKGKMTKKTLGNPSQQVKLNAIELKRFLDSKNLNIDYVLINSIVAFTGNNFKVRKMPRTYNVMNVREIPDFIVNSKIKIDMGTVTESVVLLEPYCSEMMRS